MKNPDFNQDFQEWLEALENTILTDGEDYTSELLKKLFQEAKNKGLDIDDISMPPFKNSVSSYEEVEYPGDLELEEKIRHYIRWNSMLMVLNANKNDDLGGHISTYSSAATLYEVGFNHFFKGPEHPDGSPRPREPRRGDRRAARGGSTQEPRLGPSQTADGPQPAPQGQDRPRAS